MNNDFQSVKVTVICSFVQQAFVYEGKTGELLRELGSPAHKGGIYAVSCCEN